MIPQPLKWVGAILALGIAMVVVAPFALDAMLRIVEFEDDSGLFSTDDDADPDDGLGPLDPFEDEAGGSGDDDADDDAVDAGDPAGEDAGEDDADDDDEPEEVPDTYEVQGGDTLYSIAEEVYGDGSRWTEIAEANGIDEGSALSVGTVLEIP